MAGVFDERAYIIQAAQARNLDPFAVLAVAEHEGITLPARVGDNGSSFGPWQLHVGGALPATIAAHGAAYSQQWADSPAGIDYALDGIKRVVGTKRGNAAIDAQIRLFERPRKDLVAGEIRASEASYVRLTSNANPGGMQTGPLYPAATPVSFVPSGVTSAASDAAGWFTDAGASIGNGIAAPFVKLYNLVTAQATWIRVGLFLAGVAVLVLGLKTAFA